MEIREALEFCREDDFLELLLLAHAETIAQVTGTELAASEFLNDLALAKSLREKLGRGRIIQTKDQMEVEVIEESFLLIGAVDV